jgi:hypothetical protein
MKLSHLLPFIGWWTIVGMAVLALFAFIRLRERRRNIQRGAIDVDYENYIDLRLAMERVGVHVALMSPAVFSAISVAEDEINSGKILTAGMLTAYFQRVVAEHNYVTERELVDLALKRGLYSILGRKYQQQLDKILYAAKKEIMAGQITSSTLLRVFLDGESHGITGGYDREKVKVDLLIDARQKGLYDLLPELQRPLAATVDCGLPEVFKSSDAAA